MAKEISLAQIERKAWISYFDDGLLDICLGLVLFSVGVSDLLGASLPSRLWGYAVYAVLVGAACLAFWTGKRFITIPRLGRVVFGPARKARRRKTAVILVVQIIVGMIVMGLLVATLPRFPLGGLAFARSTLLAIAVGMWVMVGLSLVAYLLDFTRGYLIAVLYAVGFGGTELLNDPVVLVLTAAVILLIGIIVLVRFVRGHRRPTWGAAAGEVSDDE